MASIEQLAEQYEQRIRESSAPAAEVQRIATEIEDLTYERTGAPISNADKDHLLEAMAGRRQGNAVGILKEADNKHYLNLVGKLRNLLGR